MYSHKVRFVEDKIYIDLISILGREFITNRPLAQEKKSKK